MLHSLVRAVLQVPLLVCGVVLAVVAFGAAQLRDMPVDALPEFSPVHVEVQTESLGLSAVEVEQLITAPMEQLLLNGVPWLDEISSQSIPGLSSILLVFEPGTDPLEARQVVQERLSQGRDLPKVAKAPVMLQPLSSTSRVMVVRVDSAALSPMQQSVLAKWTIKPALMGVPGVANVAIWGHREQQMQVQVDTQAMREQGVALSDVVRSTANSLWVSPLSFVEASTPGTGGFIDTPNQRLGIHHTLPISEPEDLAGIPLEGRDGQEIWGEDGRPVLLRDVVDVVEDHQPLIGDAVGSDEQGLLLVVEKFPEANALEVTRGVEGTLAQLGPGLDDLTFDTEVYRPASYLDIALDNSLRWLGVGLLLALLVIGLLHGVRAAVVAAVTVPLATGAAVLVLHLTGHTMNLMLWAGLVLATAAVVDDAVRDTDAVRRVPATTVDPPGRRHLLASAMSRSRRPLLVAALVTVVAAVPVFVLGVREGLDGALVQPVLLAFAVATLTAVAVALLVSPVLVHLLAARRPREHRPTPVARRLTDGYGRVLGRALRRPTVAVSVVGLLAGASLAVGPSLVTDMGPKLQERTLLVRWQAAPGTSHPEMTRVTSLVAEELRALSGIAQVGAHIGRALTSDRVVDVNVGELWASLDADADHEETIKAVRASVEGYPGIEQQVLTYTDERGQAHDLGSKASDDVVVRVYGQEYDVLAREAEEVRSAVEGVDGVTDATLQSQPRQPQIEVVVDLGAARRYGVTPGQVRRAAATLVSGIEVGSLFEQQKVFEVVVLGSPDLRHDVRTVEDLLIDSPTFGQVRLGQVADVRVVPVPTAIRHSAVSRYVDVVAHVGTADAGDVAEGVEAAVASVAFPLEYHAELLEDHREDRAAALRALGLAAGALVLVLLLLQAQLRSWRLAALAFAGWPVALSGALSTAAVLQVGLDLGVLLGLLVLTGVYLRCFLTLHDRLETAGLQRDRPLEAAAVTGGARDWFLPTAGSTLALVALLLPAAVLGSSPGLELVHPMAVVVLGGLLTTLPVVLLVLPVMYTHIAPDLDTTGSGLHDDRPARTSVAVA